MSEPFTCYCGLKTREPFLINGLMLCALCADKIAPRLVDTRAARNWQAFVQSNHAIPTRPGYRSRWKDEDDD